MLQLTLARDHLLCGYGNESDPSRDIHTSGQVSRGCRPQLFFGPSRDALHLVTRKLHAALLIRPRVLSDLEPRLWVLALPGGDRETRALWAEESRALGRQIRPLVRYAELEAMHSHLAADADIYEQQLRIAADDDPEGPLRSLRVSITAAVDGDSLRERWAIEHLPRDWTAQLAYWFQPEIAASDLMQSTLYYEPARAIVAYRGSVCFGLLALDAAQESLRVAFAETGASQHTLARSRLGDIIRASWAQDDLLGFAAEGKKADRAWLPLEPKNLLSLGAADALIVWNIPAAASFELQFRLTTSLNDLEAALPALDFARIRQIDRTWLAAQKALPAQRSERLQQLYARTLLTLRQMQDPEGGIIAAPEFHYELTHCGGYGFCWGRDAGFISYAMDVCGMHSESAHFYRYMQRCQSPDGSFLHRHDMAGKLAASWGLLQPDETGSVLFGLWQHVRLSGGKETARELKDMIVKAGNWLAHARHSIDPELPIEGFDLWEEREGVHLYTVAAMAAGLDAGIALLDALGEKAPDIWFSRALELKELCTSPRFLEQSGTRWTFARSIRRRVSASLAAGLTQLGAEVSSHRSPSGRLFYELERDRVADISQLAITYPYAVVDMASHRHQLSALVSHLRERLWRPGQGGIGRYESDYYRDGNPWVLSTLWLGLAAAEGGQVDIARETWNWVLEHMPAEGMLPEQIDPKSGGIAWVLPLTWSHAMFALALHHLPDEVFS